jgi:hypothetical protein
MEKIAAANLYAEGPTDMFLSGITTNRELESIRMQRIQVRWYIPDERHSPQEVILARLITRKLPSRHLMYAIELSKRSH